MENNRILMEFSLFLLFLFSLMNFASGQYGSTNANGEALTNPYYNMHHRQMPAANEEEEEEEQATTPSPTPTYPPATTHHYPADPPIPRIPVYSVPQPRYIYNYYPRTRPQPRRIVIWRPRAPTNSYPTDPRDQSCRLSGGQCSSLFQPCYGISLYSFCTGQYTRCCISLRAPIQPNPVY